MEDWLCFKVDFTDIDISKYIIIAAIYLQLPVMLSNWLALSGVWFIIQKLIIVSYQLPFLFFEEGII